MVAVGMKQRWREPDVQETRIGYASCDVARMSDPRSPACKDASCWRRREQMDAPNGKISFWVAVIGLAAWFSGGLPVSAQEELYGSIGCHDPSTLVKDGSRYYFFRTGSGIPFNYSTDLRNWTSGGKIFPGNPPAWVAAAVPGYDPNNWAWAPDVAYFNGKYHVYYSVSEWGTIDSVIGLVTSTSLISPGWTDQGKVIQSDAVWDAVPETDVTDVNCIDPAVFQDTDSRIWLVFGSYSDGIRVTELDPSTGKRISSSAPIYKIADNGPGFFSNTTEGAFVYKHNGYYYLFVNFGGCCSGIDSTYHIRVGRSTSITGPYLDREGINMNSGGGTMLLESSGRFVGPGHAGILNDNGTEWFTYHYYTWSPGLWSQLGLSRLSWDGSDWPVLPNDWSAFYPFNTDAREHSDWYDGSLQSGASIVTDDMLGKVLELDGSGYVLLHEAVANCSSVAAWVKWNGGDDWQRIFDFGADTTKYMFLTPKAYGAGMRFTIKNGGSEQIVDAPAALPTDTWCHVAVTLDGELGVMYLNGDAIATNSVTIRPWEMLARNNYIGDSQFSADPGFNGRISSFRLFAHALSPEEVREIAYAQPALAHRYSFASDVGDSIGMAHGRLKGSAAISAGALSLPGTSGSYASLPGGLVSGCGAVSIEFWADIGANGYWSRIFDFGNISGASGNSFLFLTPAMSAGQYRMDMNGRTLDISGSTLNNKSVHVVCIVDPASSYTALYVNGKLVNQQTLSTPALSTIGKSWSFLGRSLFSADPYLNGAIDEFRVYDGRLTPQQIADNYSAGPDVIYQSSSFAWTNNAGNLTFEWPSYPAGYNMEYSTVLGTNTSWSALDSPVPADGGYSLTIPMDSISTSNAFFRLNR